MPADKPGGGDEGREQPSGKNASGLERIDAEDLADVGRVVAPLVNDIKNLRADDPAEHDENPEIPRVVAVIAESLGIANADPQTQEDSERDQESIGRKEETSYVKELWEHWLLDAAKNGIATGSV